MATPDNLILFEEDEARLAATLKRLTADAKGRATFLLDKNGRVITAAGETAGLDLTALASLVAGSAAATGSLANLVGEAEFNGLVLEGQRANLTITTLDHGLILVVLFDEKSTLGLVRFRVRRAAEEIGQAFVEIARRASRGPDQAATASQGGLSEITDDDIENLLKS